jgi:hypothetical protein
MESWRAILGKQFFLGFNNKFSVYTDAPLKENHIFCRRFLNGVIKHTMGICDTTTALYCLNIRDIFHVPNFHLIFSIAAASLPIELPIGHWAMNTLSRRQEMVFWVAS